MLNVDSGVEHSSTCHSLSAPTALGRCLWRKLSTLNPVVGWGLIACSTKAYRTKPCFSSFVNTSSEHKK